MWVELHIISPIMPRIWKFRVAICFQSRFRQINSIRMFMPGPREQDPTKASVLVQQIRPASHLMIQLNMIKKNKASRTRMLVFFLLFPFSLSQ